jgi:hypothetical protein
MEIEFDENEPFVIDAKRFRFPAKLKGMCPLCGEEIERDFSEDYLSEPIANEVETVTIYHEWENGEGDCEFEVGLRLTVNLELVE